MVTPEKGASSESGASAKAITSMSAALMIKKMKPMKKNLRLKKGRSVSVMAECFMSTRPMADEKQPTSASTMPTIHRSMVLTCNRWSTHAISTLWIARGLDGPKSHKKLFSFVQMAITNMSTSIISQPSLQRDTLTD